MIGFVALVGVAVAAALSLGRMIMGPTQHDRALALRSLAIKAALVSAALGVVLERPDYLDVALVFALGAVVVLVAIARVFRLRNLQAPLAIVEET